MPEISRQEVQSRLGELFRDWFPNEPIEIRTESTIEDFRTDILLELGSLHFAGEISNRGDLAAVKKALDRFRRIDLPVGAIELLIVPYMRESGAQRCREQNISWVDLSGNAHIASDRILVHVEGKPNRYRDAREGVNPFAPKSSRVVRFLLQHPEESFSQQNIAERTQLGESYVSKIVRSLQNDRLVERSANRQVTVRDPDLLLDAWYEKYEFAKHRTIKGTVAARDSRELVEKVSVAARQSLDMRSAATGLAAAWLMTKFAQFRIVTFYLEAAPPSDWKRAVGLREDPKGANLWLVIPNDEGIFQGVESYDGIDCVDPAQVYLDLKGHPERADEAAEAVRNDLLTWNDNA